MIEFYVPGIPQPGGSKRAIPIFKKGPVDPSTGQNTKVFIRANVVDDAKGSKDWKSLVANTALPYLPLEPLLGPIRLEILFVFARPKHHFGTGKNATKLKDSSPDWCDGGKPADLTKLVRSTEDALTGLAWKDDKQVASQGVDKIWGLRPGAIIKIIPLPPKRVDRSGLTGQPR